MRSKILRALTKLSFINTRSLRFWLYLSISLTILGRKTMLERYSS